MRTFQLFLKAKPENEPMTIGADVVSASDGMLWFSRQEPDQDPDVFGKVEFAVPLDGVRWFYEAAQ